MHFDRGKSSNEGGFTAVELLLAMTLLLLVTGAAITMYFTLMRAHGTTQAMIDLNDEARAAMRTLSADIKASGYGEVRAGVAPIQVDGSGFDYRFLIPRGLTFLEAKGTVNSQTLTVEDTSLLAGATRGLIIARDQPHIQLVEISSIGSDTVTLGGALTHEYRAVSRFMAVDIVDYIYDSVSQTLTRQVLNGPATTWPNMVSNFTIRFLNTEGAEIPANLIPTQIGDVMAAEIDITFSGVRNVSLTTTTGLKNVFRGGP